MHQLNSNFTRHYSSGLSIKVEGVEKKLLRFVTDSPHECIEAMSQYDSDFSTYFTKNQLEKPKKVVVDGPDNRAYSLFIGYYYLMYLVKNEPKKLVDKELWQHISDLRRFRKNFMPCCREYYNLMHHGHFLQ